MRQMEGEKLRRNLGPVSSMRLTWSRKANRNRCASQRESCGNCRAYGKVEKRTACFPTFPQALGKLVANYAPSFPQFPQLLLLLLSVRREEETCDISKELKHVTFLKSFDSLLDDN